ncbi:FAD-binding oxidoreductase [Allokutzneria albata]|uniref:Alkyldihydroxyacetonephosphate synthase n=1 Tax=Allokutzneria albata TaxID=211114 RepID=A0A1H0AZY4_ALLAB|nr:FAD-binding oxidoreductase [Allokutzneria albata]SDN39027.1 alkyldihydroxyacetonephosphate synthase [Allokutzneria albata]
MNQRIDHTLRGSWTSAPAAEAHLPPHALRWLRSRTGLGTTITPEAPGSVLAVPDSRLGSTVRTALAEVVGEAHVLVDRDARLGRAGGLSYVDLMRRRGAGEPDVPDAVVLPADPEQVQRVLEVCVEHDIAVVPFGGGTSVVGGVNALRGNKNAVISLDLVHLDQLVSVDPVSHTAVFRAGVRAPDAERLLAAHGFTLGHFPQSFERATLGGFAVTRSSGQASAGYGRFEEMVVGVRMATPQGEMRLGGVPASAAGPDLKRLVIGSEGLFGVVTELTLRVRSAPRVKHYEGFILDGWDRGADAVRELAQARALADVTRLSDVDETEVSFELSGGWKVKVLKAYLRARGVVEPCMLVLGWETGSPRELATRRTAALRRLRRFRPVALGRALGETWRKGRFNGPRQRDVLLDAGVCVETLETAATWSDLTALRTAVRGALIESLGTHGSSPVVMCHISHAYETGASLYFTTLTPRSADDPLGQWQRAKVAACEAIVRHSGTISHHHAVGVDHAPWLGAEIGDLGLEVLRAVKQRLDPTGVLNPGKLVGDAKPLP